MKTQIVNSKGHACDGCAWTWKVNHVSEGWEAVVFINNLLRSFFDLLHVYEQIKDFYRYLNGWCGSCYSNWDTPNNTAVVALASQQNCTRANGYFFCLLKHTLGEVLAFKCYNHANDTEYELERFLGGDTALTSM